MWIIQTIDLVLWGEFDFVLHVLHEINQNSMLTNTNHFLNKGTDVWFVLIYVITQK